MPYTQTAPAVRYRNRTASLAFTTASTTDLVATTSRFAGPADHLSTGNDPLTMRPHSSKSRPAKRSMSRSVTSHSSSTSESRSAASNSASLGVRETTLDHVASRAERGF
ncbi:hypothetical protein HYQ46_006314 [Verticillium longisporum]|nr:hypothetical protein HYQ46_006314 [Verticillium longisporum]